MKSQYCTFFLCLSFFIPLCGAFYAYSIAGGRELSQFHVGTQQGLSFDLKKKRCFISNPPQTSTVIQRKGKMMVESTKMGQRMILSHLYSRVKNDDEASPVSELEEGTNKTATPDSIPWPSYAVLGMLLVAFASNQWSRQALYYLCDFSADTSDPYKHINRELGFSQEMYGTLASLGFTIFFAAMSLFAGNASDRFSRSKVIAASCAAWSIATALQGTAESYMQLLPLRAIVGGSQAFFNPAAYTLLADIFPKKMLGGINGIFSSGIYLGGALASLSIILDESVGWRRTLVLIGGVGIFVSAFCLILIPEPRNRTSSEQSTQIASTPTKSVDTEIQSLTASVTTTSLYESSEQKGINEQDSEGNDDGDSGVADDVESAESSEGPLVALREVLAPYEVSTSDNITATMLSYLVTDMIVILLVLTQVLVQVLGVLYLWMDFLLLALPQAKLLFSAAALRFCAGFSLIVWKAPFIFAKFPGNEAAFAGGNAVVVAVGGILSSLLGGYLSDKLSNPTDAIRKPLSRSWVPAVGSFLAAPFWVGFILSPTPSVAVLWLFLEYLAAECWFGPTLASLFEVVPSHRRGAAQGFFSLLTAVGNLAPVLVGMLVDGGFYLPSFLGSTDSGSPLLQLDLATALIVFVSGAYLLSSVIFAAVARLEDIKINERWQQMQNLDDFIN